MEHSSFERILELLFFCALQVKISVQRLLQDKILSTCSDENTTEERLGRKKKNAFKPEEERVVFQFA